MLRLTPLLLLACLCAPFSALAQHPAKLAASARFDIVADAAVGSLDAATVLSSDGEVGRQLWIDDELQPLSLTAEFPAPAYMWTEMTLQFTPVRSGTIILSLMGPWEATPEGPIYRQEMLWDGLAAEGAVLRNGSFEDLTGGQPDFWTNNWGEGATLDTESADPLDGSNMARSWHNGPWQQTIYVTGGEPVTLTLHARAYQTDEMPANPRITDPNSPAHVHRLNFMRGVNLGNYLEAPAGEDWGQTYDEDDFVQIAAEGFDHVRLPARWNDYTGPAPDFAIEESFALKVDRLVNFALENGLNVIVNIHHFDDLTDDPAREADKFYAIWEQIAARYADLPLTVCFELLNEPKDNATTTVMNPLFAEAIRRIRVSNPTRPIMVGPGNYNNISELPNLILPEDENLIVTVHSYAPFWFTHQGATWTGAQTLTRGIVYPGPPDTPLEPHPVAAEAAPWVAEWIHRYNTLPEEVNPSSRHAFVGALEMAKAWGDYYGRPVHVGEFGAFELADPVSRARFYAEKREVMDELGLGWAMWDWKAGFKFWDEANEAPAPGLREAIFPDPQASLDTSGALHLEGAIGKRYIIRRATTLGGQPATWPVLEEIALASPVHRYHDQTQPTSAAFYVVEWLRN